MINTSKEFKKVITGQNRTFYGNAYIELSNGTVIDIDSNKVKILKIDDATSQMEQFTIGSAVINKLTLSFNNMDDAYSDYDFTGAVIRPSVGLRLSSTIETLQKGVFTADDPKVRSSIITLTALDNMHKFDKPFKDVVQIFPCTNYALLSAVCIHCGVDLATHSFMNGNYTVQSRPVDDAINCREIISWIAAMAGCFARCNTSGELELKWYDLSEFESENNKDGGFFDSVSPYATGDNVDGGNLSNYQSGDNVDAGLFTDTDKYHNFYSITNNNISTDDVVITGIKVVDNSETPNTALFGQEGYVISIEGNKLIQSQSDAQTIANSVGAKIVGMRFRPLSITTRSDPSVEAGDIAYVSVRKGVVYQTVITNISYSIYQSMRITCDAESPARNSATRYSESAKTIVEARKNTEHQISEYDKTVQQLTNLITNGFGLFKTEEVDSNGGIKYYMHDKLAMSESSIRWLMTSEGIIEQNKVDGVWITVSGTDKHGNALYNVLTARKISADIIRTGKIYSDSGDVLIDMAYGVANSDNISETGNIQDGFPMTIDFYIDEKVSKINNVLLNYKLKKFRTYSTTAETDGSALVSSESGGGSTETTSTHSSSRDTSTNTQLISIGSTSLTTNINGSSIVPHNHSIDGHDHSVYTSGHWHSVSWSHDHSVDIPDHAHKVDIPPHSHELNFGIMEYQLQDNNALVFVDGVQRAVISEAQGIIDLTAFVTTGGWHIIEIRSTTLKRVSARVNIKSYIRS